MKIYPNVNNQGSLRKQPPFSLGFPKVSHDSKGATRGKGSFLKIYWS